MAKRTITLDSGWVGGVKGKIAAAVIVAIIVVVAAYNIGNDSGYKKGYDDGYGVGNDTGLSTGDKSGFERGYWIGREDGCLWVFDQTRKPYVVGEGNPFTTWYYLMDLGNIYLSRDNCSTSGHGAAPYSGGPSTSN
jgi:hypothetical protein